MEFQRIRSNVQRFNRSRLQPSDLLSVVELLNPLNLEQALAQAPFYQGKTIRIIVGYQPGDSHDLWARTYIRFLGKHIPGNPDFVVQNMPGAGSMIAANHVFNLTKPDGLTLGSIGGALFMAQLTGRKEVQFDWPKYAWIMTPDRGGHLLYMRTDAPYKTFEDLRQTNDPPKCSATGVGSTGYDLPKLLEEALGFKFRVISGYPGGADQDLALERGEVHCRAFIIESFFQREPFPSWIKKNFVRVWLQTEPQAPSQAARCTDGFRIDGPIQSFRLQAALGQYLSRHLGIWLAADCCDTGPTGGSDANSAGSICQNVQGSGVSRRTKKAQLGSRVHRR